MKTLKRTILRFFFAGELMVFFSFYLFGSHGLQYVWRLEQEQQELMHDLALLDDQVSSLQQQLHAINTQSFYKEKYARETLHMARADETIYLLK